MNNPQKKSFLIMNRVMLSLALLLISTATSAQVCNPSVPSYTQIGCTEVGQQTSSPSYTLPTTTPYSPPTSTIPYSLPTEGPSWEKLEEESTTTNIDSGELLTYVQETLRDIAILNSTLDTQKTSLIYFAIDLKKLKAELTERRVGFQEIEGMLKENNTDAAEQRLEELDDFVSETFIDTLDLVKQAYDMIRRMPNKKVKTLLRTAFKPIRESITKGDSSTAHETLNLYLDDLKKNRKLYATKKLTTKNRKKIQTNVKILEGKLIAVPNEIEEGEKETREEKVQKTEVLEPKEMKKIEPVKVEEVKKIEKKVPIQTDVYKRINEGIQKQIQFDAWTKVYDLGSGIR